MNTRAATCTRTRTPPATRTCSYLGEISTGKPAGRKPCARAHQPASLTRLAEGYGGRGGARDHSTKHPATPLEMGLAPARFFRATFLRVSVVRKLPPEPSPAPDQDPGGRVANRRTVARRRCRRSDRLGPAAGTRHGAAERAFEPATVGAGLSRGLGRSYGDSSLPARATDKLVGTRLADRILGFDAETGVLRAEAGLSLAEINPAVFMPRAASSRRSRPGTKFVTLGGMVASDVHGKNHHREGCFGAHVRSLRMRLADNSLVTCSPTQDSDLFYGTIGGMGLLGHVLEAGVRAAPGAEPLALGTKRARLRNRRVSGWALGQAAPAWPMTVGWIMTGLSRGRS